MRRPQLILLALAHIKLIYVNHITLIVQAYKHLETPGHKENNRLNEQCARKYGPENVFGFFEIASHKSHDQRDAHIHGIKLEVTRDSVGVDPKQIEVTLPIPFPLHDRQCREDQNNANLLFGRKLATGLAANLFYPFVGV